MVAGQGGGLALRHRHGLETDEVPLPGATVQGAVNAVVAFLILLGASAPIQWALEADHGRDLVIDLFRYGERQVKIRLMGPDSSVETIVADSMLERRDGNHMVEIGLLEVLLRGLAVANLPAVAGRL